MEGNTGASTIYNFGYEFVLERFLQPCWNQLECNLIENNTGTAISVDFGIDTNNTSISNTTFKNNSRVIALTSLISNRT